MVAKLALAHVRWYDWAITCTSQWFFKTFCFSGRLMRGECCVFDSWIYRLYCLGGFLNAVSKALWNCLGIALTDALVLS
jgi:hypothetical protein